MSWKRRRPVSIRLSIDQEIVPVGTTLVESTMKRLLLALITVCFLLGCPSSDTNPPKKDKDKDAQKGGAPDKQSQDKKKDTNPSIND